MKVIIAGSRTIEKYELVERAVRESGYEITQVISGTATGADRLGEQWAKNNNVPVIQMPANWNKYGKSAGPRRNKEMSEIADAAIVIWDGKSRGSKNMIWNMRNLNKPYFMYLDIKTDEIPNLLEHE